MTETIAAGARAAAERLDSEFGPGLVSEVESVLLGAESGQSDRYIDPISLASLIVSIASLTWNVYSDQRKKTPRPADKDIVRVVRTELHSPGTAGPAPQDKITEVVVTEVIRAARKDR
jgi:uncharacterized membrane protein YebE (DUF533 family)